jgi:hypothetical protein
MEEFYRKGGQWPIGDMNTASYSMATALPSAILGGRDAFFRGHRYAARLCTES